MNHFFSNRSFWGKLICTFFGFLMAGPLGALIGLLIGNLFDRGLVQHLTQPFLPYFFNKPKYIQQLFFDTTFTTLGFIAKSDGRVDSREINLATQLMNEMRFSKKQSQQAKECFREGKSANHNIHATLQSLHKACYHHRDLLRLFVDIQYRSAKQSGLNAAKMDALDVVFSALDFAPFQKQQRFYDDIHQNNHQTHNKNNQSSHQQNHQDTNSNPYLTRCYQILELPAKADKQAVKKAYRRLMSRHHPDKLMAQGLPESMIKAANDKTQQIRKAYDYIMNHSFQ